MGKRKQGNSPHDVEAIRDGISGVLNLKDGQGRAVGDCKYGIYAFYDYDGEPIYVGQTVEKLRVRIRRHLTNHRTDAVAMHVLDPFEVYEIEMWPFWMLEKAAPKDIGQTLKSAEYTVFQRLLKESEFHAVLNEVPVARAPKITLPPSLKGRIVPDDIHEHRKHSDVRIARRASTIAKLAQVISERAVQIGLRKTLLIQARRLEHLASKRTQEVQGDSAQNGASDDE